MSDGAPRHWEDADALAAAIIEETKGHIVLALPLGLGKPVQFANALFHHARADQRISLTIYTALTLEKPFPKNEIERRFLEPISERLFEDYVDLDYARALRSGNLPENIRVYEFFLTAGQWLGVEAVQQNYVSANYTHAWRYILDAGVNVLAQLVAPDHKKSIPETYSLSCNPDITLDLLSARTNGEAEFVFIGQVNDELPYMGADAEIAVEQFDHILGGDAAHLTLFNTPKRPVTLVEYAAGFHAARLIQDGGTLQIGIGSVGDAIAHALIMRHENNDAFRRIVNDLAAAASPLSASDERPFEEGLYGASEMLVDTFLDLIEAGVVKREVDGCLINAAFFLGPKSFYKKMRDMPDDRRKKIGMTSVLFVNDAHRDFDRKQRNRKKARFINNAMKATLLGAIVSDGLDSGQVVSGVGGQFDFIQQAFALEGARSIIMMNAVRNGKHGLESNILWSYGHATIPRHFRDIVVTEYGVADVRGKSDAAVVEEMLSITDVRFHAQLIDEAKAAGKLPANFAAHDSWRNNTPGHIQSVLCAARAEGLLPEFPFGTELTEAEKDLLPALERLKNARASKSRLARFVVKGVVMGKPDKRELQSLRRMGLDDPTSGKEHLYRFLLRGALELG